MKFRPNTGPGSCGQEQATITAAGMTGTGGLPPITRQPDLMAV